MRMQSRRRAVQIFADKTQCFAAGGDIVDPDRRQHRQFAEGAVELIPALRPDVLQCKQVSCAAIVQCLRIKSTGGCQAA